MTGIMVMQGREVSGAYIGLVRDLLVDHPHWVRVKWHLDRDEFSAAGYFPGIQLRPDAPRLLLVSPSLEFHPTTETLLGFFAPHIEVERVGLAVEWRKGLHVMFRLSGAQRPQIG